MEDRAPERVGVGLRGAAMAVRTGRAVLLRRPADVAMVEATDFRNLDDRPQLRPLDWPLIRRIFLEREMSS